MSCADNLKRLRARWLHLESLNLDLDASGASLDDKFLAANEPPMQRAFDEMAALEEGAIANPDENRKVGHYWLRDPQSAPTPELRDRIRKTIARLEQFAGDLRSGRVTPPTSPRFTDFLLIGVGGSALGPQLLTDALERAPDGLTPHFLDNTDPDGFDRTLAALDGRLHQTLLLVISKSGGTIETRNAMLEAEAAYRRRGLDVGPHAVAVTSDGSALADHALRQAYLTTFPMWDWVGGRTSLTSAVGLLPAALAGIPVRELLEGARLMDQATRRRDPSANPAALMALVWYNEGGGRGRRAMVLLPYKDRLLLLPRYLQQLVMESVGKAENRAGLLVEQKLLVYGNKGSTDQHAFVQQLRDGPRDFFLTFVQVRRDRAGASLEVEPGVTSGDYLHGFMLGTRRALAEKRRSTVTLSLPDLSARSLGALVALFERAVGLYAALIDINAYNQPGVEAGKLAASEIIALQRRILATLRAAAGAPLAPLEVARRISACEHLGEIYFLLRHLAASEHHPVEELYSPEPLSSLYRVIDSSDASC